MAMFGLPGSGYAASAPQAAALQAQMHIQKQIRRLGEQCYWSTQLYTQGTNPASSVARLFTTPRNQQGQGFGRPLSVAETNIQEAGRIPSQFAFTVYAIAQHIFNADCSPTVFQDQQNFIANCVVQWRFVQSIIEVAPSWLVPGGGGVFGSTADTGNGDGSLGSREALNSGNGGVWIYRSIPIALSSNTTFSVEQAWGDGAIAIDGRSVVGGVANPGAANVAARVCLIGAYQAALANG